MIPKISILMANYNNGKFIKDAVKSVLKQTNDNWELIIIDDCSTDNSVGRIKALLNDDRVFLYQNEKNCGYIETLRRLLIKSHYNIVGVLDSDDTLNETAVEDILNAYAANKDCGLIYSQFMYCDEKMEPISLGFCAQIPTGMSNIQCNCISAFRTFKKDIYYKTEGFSDEIIYAEDKDLYLKLEEETELFFVNKVLYNYRMLNDSQNHHPSKSAIGRLSYIYAKCNAYNRRKGTNIPNLKRIEVLKEIIAGFKECYNIKDYKSVVLLLNKLIKILIVH